MKQVVAIKKLDQSALGTVGVIFTTACWGMSGIFVKFVSTSGQVEPLALAFWRDLVTFGLLLLGVGLLRPNLLRVQRRDLGWLFGLGAMLGVFHVFWILAVMLNGAAVATVQQAAMPAMVTLVAWLAWREPLTGRKLLAIALTFGGTVLVSGLDELLGADFSWAGALVGLGLPITYAAFSLLGKKMRIAYSPLTTTTYSFAFAALTLLPTQFFVDQPFPVSGETLGWFAGFVAVATIVPWLTYTTSLGYLPASVVSILAMSEIPFVALYAYFLIGERLAPIEILGAVAVVAGVLLLVERHPKPAVN